MVETDAHLRARIISEALPFIRKYHGRTIVVKIGGQVLIKQALRAAFARDVSLLTMVGVRILIVHGGGPQISKRLTAAGIEDRKVNGLRYTDTRTMEIVEHVLSEEINGLLVSALQDAGTTALRVRGNEDGLLQTQRKTDADYGLVGDITGIGLAVLDNLPVNTVPVIAPLGADVDGTLYNINADTAAAALATAVHAEALLLLTDIDGVLDSNGKVVPVLDAKQIDDMLTAGTITAGMLPKVKCAMVALTQGVVSCRILNGTTEHPLLLDLLTDAGVGTMIIN